MPEPRLDGAASRRAAWLIALLMAAAYLPFLNKAIHIDDRIYLEVAGNILQKPFHPYDFPAIHEGFQAPDAASHSHLPLTSYYLAVVRLLAGNSREWVYHLAFLVFPLVAALGFYDLALRVVRFPAAATALLLVAPGFLVLGHSLMTDVPFLAFWIFSLSRFVRIVEGEAGRADWYGCGLSLLAAAFLSLLTAGLLLLMVSYLILRRRAPQVSGLFQRGAGLPPEPGARVPGLPRNSAIACLLALPLLLWTAWYVKDYFHYDRFVLINTFLHMNYRAAFSGLVLGEKGLSFLLNVGATFLFPLALWYGMAGRWSARAGAAVFLLSFFPFYVGPWVASGESWPLIQKFLLAAFLSSGLVVLIGILHLARWFASTPPAKSDRRSTGRDAEASLRALLALMLLWFAGIAFAYVFFFYSGSARYAMLALPPVLLLWQRRLEERIAEPYLVRNLLGLTLVLTFLYSGAIAFADYRWAAAYREAAGALIRDYAEPQRTVWFAGEWGFRYYMLQNGARILTKVSPEPGPGDIIIKPFVAMPWVSLFDGGDYTDLLEQRPLQINFPVRLLDFSARAGFYSTGWGILPVGWQADERWEWFNVFRVKKKYEDSVPEPERPW